MIDCACGCGLQLEACDRKGRARRFVHGHNRRRMARDRFEEKVREVEGHWVWTGAVTADGYPVFWEGARLVYAHRWAYAEYVGPIPPGFEVDHVCRVRSCVRPHPEHLEAVTGGENNRRRDQALGWGSYR